MTRAKPLQHFLKRAMDIFGSLLGLILLSPVLITVAVLVRIYLGSPILFRQVRPGLNAKPFTMLKFRTMTDAKDEQGNLLPDADRLTPFGRFLRSTSLDELPELINVLKGDMSLVGPRPLLMRYLPFYTCSQRMRMSVKPGITGFAQTNGRNLVGWNKRFAYDVIYARNWSVIWDMKIIFLTMLQVFRSKGIAVDPQKVMVDFDAKRSNNRRSRFNLY